MKRFLDDDFCLKNETGKMLYHTYAEKLPIIDYHCHLDPKDIALDKTFENLAQLWLAGDHYKWRLMRADGAGEEYVTGDADADEKLRLWARVLEKSIGNPLHHWSHMELKKYFDYDGVIKGDNADVIIEHCEPYFKSGCISARKLIEKSKVTHICTTDDPVSNLEWHKVISEDESFKTKVYPSWRPDRILNCEKADFADYIKELAKAAGIGITTFADLKKAVRLRIEYFASFGTRTADHGLDSCFYEPFTEAEVEAVFKKALQGDRIDYNDALKYKSAMLLFMAEDYCRLGWVMQLHYGCSRNVNTRLFDAIGADTGIDCINPDSPSRNLAKMLDAFDSRGILPKTIVYSLDPSENTAIDTVIGCFQGKGKGYVQHGAAWWFNDHKGGMEEHIKSLAAGGVLGNFVGMLTDSRSFVSYTRHDYFRRIFCNLLGQWVEDGEYPYDEAALSKIVKDVCYFNALEFFNLA